MSYMLSHLHNGWQVDQAILSEEDRVVVSILILTFSAFFHNAIGSYVLIYKYDIS